MVSTDYVRRVPRPSFVFTTPRLTRRPLEWPFSLCRNRLDMTAESTSVSPRPADQRRAPRKFVRLVPSSESNDVLLLQTAIITYTLPYADEKIMNKDPENASAPSRKIRIYSLLHIADPSYYESLQSSLSALVAGRKTPSVLFELLTSSRNLLTEPYPRLKSRLIATPSARSTAMSLGAVAQVDALDLSRASWRHADLTTDDVLARGLTTRRFSIPTDLIFRGIFFALPFPELYAVIVDIAMGRAQLTIRTALAAFAAGGLVAARRLTFACKMAALRYTSPTALDLRRNTAAWDGVRDTLLNDDSASEIALLYGAWHVGALCRCAEADGWSFTNMDWCTAMTVSAPPLTLFRLLPVIGAISAYATYSALDWVSLVARLGLALESPERIGGVGVEVLLYAVRHGAPYIAFWKWFRDWSFN